MSPASWCKRDERSKTVASALLLSCTRTPQTPMVPPPPQLSSRLFWQVDLVPGKSVTAPLSLRRAPLLAKVNGDYFAQWANPPLKWAPWCPSQWDCDRSPPRHHRYALLQARPSHWQAGSTGRGGCPSGRQQTVSAPIRAVGSHRHFYKWTVTGKFL